MPVARPPVVDAATLTHGTPPGDSPYIKPPLRKIAETTGDAAEQTRLLRNVVERLLGAVRDMQQLIVVNNEVQGKLITAITLNTEAILKHSETTAQSAKVIETHRATSEKMIKTLETNL